MIKLNELKAAGIQSIILRAGWGSNDGNDFIVRQAKISINEILGANFYLLPGAPLPLPQTPVLPPPSRRGKGFAMTTPNFALMSVD